MSVLGCLQEERFSKTSPGMFHLSYISCPMSCGAFQLVHVPWKHLRSSSPSMLFIGSGVLCLSSLLLLLLLLFWFIFPFLFFICHDFPGSRSMLNLFCWHSNIILFFFHYIRDRNHPFLACSEFLPCCCSIGLGFANVSSPSPLSNLPSIPSSGRSSLFWTVWFLKGGRG